MALKFKFNALTGNLDLVDVTDTSGFITGTGTTNEIAYFTAPSVLGSLTTATYPSLTELSYLKGVTSAVQTQLNNKQSLATNLTSLAGLSYTSLSFVKMSAAGTFSLDTNIYLTSSTGVTSVSGTTNRITSTGGTTPVIDISASYVGQASITTVGTLSAGAIPLSLVTGLGTGVATALAVNVGTAGAFQRNNDGFNGTVGATTPNTIVGTTIQANTGFVPDANDGAYLGTSALGFSDLFLAEGGVINWDNGDLTITQTNNLLSFAGATKYEFLGSGTGTLAFGDWAGSNAYFGLYMNGLTGIGDYNILSSPGDTNLYFNRPSGKDIYFSENATTSQLSIYGTTGNVKINNTPGGTSIFRSTTEGTSHLDIFDGTAPVGTLANGISLYSTSGELRVMDAAGNATLLSPHDKKTNEWIYDSVDINGKRLRIDMERMMKAINDKFGWDFIHEFEIK